MKLLYISSMLISSVMILLAMAFYTLLERKYLGYFQIRKGPNKVTYLGIPQPITDALKLLSKEMSIPMKINFLIYNMSPLLSLILSLLMWSILFPILFSSFYLTYSILLFLCISSMGVYTIIMSGWSSNSKYTLIGSLRGMAQTISYEISMAMTMMSPLILLSTFSLIMMSNTSYKIILLLSPIFLIWMASILAETNRSPFDLSEGESELVSGFNTEYSGAQFTLIFMAEYLMILFMSMITVNLFMPPAMNLIFYPIYMMMIMLISSMFIWIRGIMPRMRYDSLMYLTWKIFLPLSLISPMFLLLMI